MLLEALKNIRGVTIVSTLSEEIRQMIVCKLGCGVTLYQGKGGFERDGEQLKSYNIIFTVLTRLEVSKLESEVNKIDPNAF